MASRPEKLVISYRWRIFLARYWPFLILMTVVMNFTPSPNWLDVIGLYLSGIMCLAILLERPSRQYVVIDGSGISCAAWTSGRAWSQFEACAYKDEDTQRILRLFYRRETAGMTPTAGRQDVTPLAEIDFNDATNAEQSLEKAFQACAEWIAATGAPQPIRPFADGPPLKKTTFLTPKPEFILLALIILFPAFFILWQYMQFSY